MFAGNVLKVLRGTVVAQLIGFLALPLISRLFSPDSLGSLQAMLSVLTMFLVASALRLEIAIMSISEEELPSLVSLCMWLCVATSGMVFVGVVVWSVFFLIENTKFGALLYVLPLSLLMASWGIVLTYLALRFKEFDLNANAKIIQAVAYSSASAGFGVMLPTSVGLALADLAGRLLYCAVCLKQFRKKVGGIFLRIPKVAVASIWSQYRKLTLISLPGALINTLGSSYTPFFLLLIFGAAEAGQYALVERVVGLPIGMITGAISQVFIAHFAEAGRGAGESQRGLFRQSILRQFKLGIVPAAITFILAPTLFPIVFGSNWSNAGHYAQLLIPLFLVSFIVGPVNMALTIAGHQALQFAWDLGRFCIIGGTWFLIYFYKLPIINAMYLYCVTASISYIAYLVITDFALRRTEVKNTMDLQTRNT